MNKSKSKCCEKCHAVIKAFPSSSDCDDTLCPCHTSMPNSSKQKEIAKEWPGELYECQLCSDMTPDKGTCFMCKETTI